MKKYMSVHHKRDSKRHKVSRKRRANISKTNQLVRKGVFFDVLIGIKKFLE